MCHKQLDFGSVFKLDITVDFEGGDITSDAGGLLLKEIDSHYKITKQTGDCLSDDRDPAKTSLTELLRQRVFQIALGYEDQNDADKMKKDPTMKTVVGRRPLRIRAAPV
ncbi:MAG: transposase [Deltaproteobacteria bacterium]|nr:transposase [Deltaproteobacteria bacterium]